ncbi:alpha/beta hydrolase [Bradyrhizobium lablabi]|uniref:alpha/beta hydrolase n=1 Tax=Bradyrhizobium lablabi TaxID=722472 RepID=UPI001BA6E12E|nr:alpha/beta hydrolase [Bradyrhizobium lablabi]MBR0697734.1 alpha/beta hydrolase [Bradyrhizobium lablabi]
MDAVAQFGFPHEPLRMTKDLVIPGIAGPLTVRLYVPLQELARPAPALLYCHGGGFVAGGLDIYDTALGALANRAGCLIVSVAYRLAPEHPYPAANEDVWAALKWLSRTTEINADPRRIAVGGDSAGGLLAAWVAQKARSDGLPLRLQALLYPNLDATASSKSWHELGTGAYGLGRDEMLDWYGAYLPSGVDRTDPKVSPVYATDLAGSAPALIITAEFDPLRDEGNEYAAKLRAADVPVNHYCWPGMIHGLISLGGVLDAGGPFLDRVSNGLRSAFYG